VGKTTVAVGLARALVNRGNYSVLLDLDPAGHATTLLAPGAGELGPSLGAVLAGRWAGPAAELVRTGTAGVAVVPAVGLADVGAVLASGAEDRLTDLVADLTSGQTTVVIDCPPGRRGRVGPFTASAVAALARAQGVAGVVLAVMTPAEPEVNGTAALLDRVPPGARLGLVVNRVADSTIGASLHDLGRHLRAPVLARIPSVEHPLRSSAVDATVGALAELLTNENRSAAAWTRLGASPDGATRRDAELVGLLEADLARVALDPRAELDSEFDLGVELLQGTHVYDRLTQRRDDLRAARVASTDPPPQGTAIGMGHQLAPWAPWAPKRHQ
jgi:MinD-like ATPase involved in chromosome partitioning or flagellar assembly